MQGLFDSIRNTVEAAINHDNVSLGTSIVDIVQNGVELGLKILGLA